MTSHKGTEPRPLTGPEQSLTDGAPQQLTSQLRSLSLVTVRSAKSPRLTSPPPIVSMMKTSEEKPKEPGRGRGGRGRQGQGKRKRQREAERMRSKGERQEDRIKKCSWKGRQGQTDRQGKTDEKRGRQTDRRPFGTGRLQTGGWALPLRTQKPQAQLCSLPVMAPKGLECGLKITFMRPGLGRARRWDSHFRGQPVHIPEVSKNPLEFDPTAFCMERMSQSCPPAPPALSGERPSLLLPSSNRRSCKALTLSRKGQTEETDGRVPVRGGRQILALP